MNDNFDEKLTEFLKSRAFVSPEKNITEAAIEEVRKVKRKEGTKGMGFSVRVAATAICFVVITFSGMIAFSEDVRSAASNIIQTIFALDKEGDSYKIVEKDPAEQMTILNVGGIPIKEFDRDQLVNLFGFEPFVPEKLSEYKKIGADACMKLLGKSSDLLQLSNDDFMEMLKNYPKDERLKGFDTSTFFSMIFSKNGENSDNCSLFIHAAKPLEKPTGYDFLPEEKVSEFIYRGVKCELIAQVRTDYQSAHDRQFSYDDVTKQPKGIVKVKNIHFALDGINYKAGYLSNDASDSTAFDYNETKKFVENFIDEYKFR